MSPGISLCVILLVIYSSVSSLPQTASSPYYDYYDSYDYLPSSVAAPVETATRSSSRSSSSRRSQRPSHTSSAGGDSMRATPIVGPITVNPNGSYPVIPLYSYPTMYNNTFYRIPILWTALSVALGYQVKGEIVRGLPCVTMLNQLLCTRPGTSYPSSAIERFIDENKALIRRMYGEFVLSRSAYRYRGKRFAHDEEFFAGADEEASDITAVDFDALHRYSKKSNDTDDGDGHRRYRRQATDDSPPLDVPSNSNRVDVCESKVEIVTPYWASNSAGKIRAIVNTQHFEQAIHQEICKFSGRRQSQTRRCSGDCGCEQKYKWHRLLAYDPDNDCAGIFMDWFLFPSCCVCRCDP